MIDFMLAILHIALVAAALRILLFRSPLIPHLLELAVTKEPMTHDDVAEFLLPRSKFLFNLWLCAICQTLWCLAPAWLLLCDSFEILVLLSAYPAALWIGNQKLS